jgi:hypothetical protein
VADRIAGDPRLAPYFQDCIGALDGIYVKVTVPEAAKRRYRSRKNVISQNVLVVCDFDGVLICVLVAGWEGTQDSGLLYDAMQRPYRCSRESTWATAAFLFWTAA